MFLFLKKYFTILISSLYLILIYSNYQLKQELLKLQLKDEFHEKFKREYQLIGSTSYNSFENNNSSKSFLRNKNSFDKYVLNESEGLRFFI